MIIAIVGMSGAGKTTVADMFRAAGYSYVRLGQLTLDMVKEKGLEPTEANEKPIRDQIRRDYGMAAFAILNFKKIDSLGDNVVVDGLYSYEEYLEFEKRYGNDFVCIAVVAGKEIRYQRLEKRTVVDEDMRSRPMLRSEAVSRDNSDIKELNKPASIAMAHHYLSNDGTIDELEDRFKALLGSFS